MLYCFTSYVSRAINSYLLKMRLLLDYNNSSVFYTSELKKTEDMLPRTYDHLYTVFNFRTGLNDTCY